MTHPAQTSAKRVKQLMASVALLGIAQIATGDTPSHGELAAAIRSADRPCAHVQAVKPAGENAWNVRCNSGQFRVVRGQDGSYSVD